ncbi:response regulator [Paraburkholderia guartelaensis]|uniref:Response regulator n=1 Tax=Paraburkholderia guartelaensis TaxID=2546446 RepID=A0A4R5L1I1_9BURK|nr:response regulator [Paraburkholderia guartelaensis]TDG01241.1 response regulator [Paraburkholderia guartelaensis]
MAERPLIAVVDDELTCGSLPDRSREFAERAFASAEKLLVSGCAGAEHSLVLDIALPGMSGMDLQRESRWRRQTVPPVAFTAHGDAALRQRMLKRGAVECLFKPFSDTALLRSIRAALHVK